MNITINKPRPEEIEAIKTLTKKAYAVPYHENGLITNYEEPDDLREKFEAGTIGIMSAYINDQLVGSIRYEIKEGTMRFFRLAVLENFRRKGIASKLIESVEELAKNCSVSCLGLDCVSEKFLQPFYEKRGFIAEKVIDKGDFHEVYMSKNL